MCPVATLASFGLQCRCPFTILPSISLAQTRYGPPTPGMKSPEAKWARGYKNRARKLKSLCGRPDKLVYGDAHCFEASACSRRTPPLAPRVRALSCRWSQKSHIKPKGRPARRGDSSCQRTWQCFAISHVQILWQQVRSRQLLSRSWLQSVTTPCQIRVEV